jgi:hypothetical protein
MGLAILWTATETPFALIFPLFYLPIPIDLVSLRLCGKNLQKTALFPHFSVLFSANSCKKPQIPARFRTFQHRIFTSIQSRIMQNNPRKIIKIDFFEKPLDISNVCFIL